ncbi:MAG: hypothetical protein EBY88_05775, partial [Actinobacteria bacterium]|nr:hypothetical protein [Actinomycetota bacterium]
AYIVSRDNFGPVVAQIAAVALMLDYIVTLAIQTAAGVAVLDRERVRDAIVAAVLAARKRSTELGAS